MTTTYKLKILKIIKIAVLIIFVPILLVYLGIIVPEYLACDKTMFEGQNGVDIWGSEIDCNCESQAFGEAFFQMFSIIIGGFIILLSFIILVIKHIKSSFKPT